MTTPNKPSSAPEEDQAPEPAASTQEVAWLWLSREQLCQSENISQRTFFRRLKAGDFEKRRVGRRCIYRVRQGPAGAQQEPASELDDILTGLKRANTHLERELAQTRRELEQARADLQRLRTQLEDEASHKKDRLVELLRTLHGIND